MTERINEVREMVPSLWDLIKSKKFYLTYGQYAKFRGKIHLNPDV